MKTTKNRDAVIALLKQDGWLDTGATSMESYRTASPGYGGGSIVTLGGRQRFQNGRWSVTVGERTTCFYRKPEDPESIAGRGRLAGTRVYTFRDWEGENIPTKDIEAIKAFLETHMDKPL